MVALTWPSTFGRGWGAAAVLGGLVGDWAVGAGWCPGLGWWAAVGEAWVGAPDALIRKKSAKHNVFCRFQWSGLGGGPETLICKKSAKHTVCVCNFLPILQLVADFLQIFSAQPRWSQILQIVCSCANSEHQSIFYGIRVPNLMPPRNQNWIIKYRALSCNPVPLAGGWPTASPGRAHPFLYKHFYIVTRH